MYFADTNIMVDLFRGYPPALEWYKTFSHEVGALALPGYVVMELLTWEGIRSKKELHLLYDALAEFPIYWASPDASSRALSDVYHQYLSHSLEPFDALIGHCAREYGAILYTFNQKHFKLIDGLRIEQPY